MTFFSTIPAEVYDAIGVAGFGLYVLNYSLLTVQKVNAKQITYFVINLLAASMVLIGLFSAFNLASAMIQGFWIVISICAIFMRLKEQGKMDSKAPGDTLRATGSPMPPMSAGPQRPDPRSRGGFQGTYPPGPVSERRSQPHAMG